MIINYDINNKGGGASAEGCLRYDEAQDLTAEQQAQAKENLGIEEPEPQPLTVETTYTALKALRDGGNLVPGTLYRITDYATTTTDPETQSAGHVFDIIVSALGERTLSEEARAIQHDGDTYFADSNLAAWKLWYCLDNDVERFAWADPDDGKGVICRMIDEFGNDVGYDFKNIMFKRYQITECSVNDNLVGQYLGVQDSDWHSVDTQLFKFVYTFNIYDDDWESHDLSIAGNNGEATDPNIQDGCCVDNVFGKCYSRDWNHPVVQALNNGVFIANSMSHYCGCSHNRTGAGCTRWTYSDESVGNGNPKTDFSPTSPWRCGENCGGWMITGATSRWTADDNAGGFYISSDYLGSNNFHLLGYFMYSYSGVTLPESDDLTDKTIGFDSDGNLRVWNIADETTPEPQPAVLYTAQTLTDAQKQQARENIGVAALTFNLTDEDDVTQNINAIVSGYNGGREVYCNIDSVSSYVDYEKGDVVCTYATLKVISAASGGHGARRLQAIGFANFGYVRMYCMYEYAYEEGALMTSKIKAFSLYGSTPSDYDGKQYCIKNGEWEEVEAGGGEAVQSDWNETDTDDPAFICNKPTIPQPENHQLLKSALSEPMGCSANTWATLAELNVPEDGAYQVSASARMLPADQSTAFKTATVSIELGTDAAGYTEVMEMTLPRSGEYGTLSVPVNATAGQKLRLRAISEANFYAQASPSAGKASATFIAAVRVGAIYQAQ